MKEITHKLSLTQKAGKYNYIKNLVFKLYVNYFL